jgi:transcriptional regulator with XRE-family HTH domain
MLNLSKRFGTNLKKIRESKHKRQIDLGADINSSEDTIANYENGRRWPDAETIEALASSLGVDPVEFFKKISSFDEVPIE